MSVLDEKGTPTVTERAWIAPPSSQIGPIADADREAVRKRSLGIYGHYDQTVDRESAYEKLKARTEERAGGVGGAGLPAEAGTAKVGAPPPASGGGLSDALSNILLGSTGPRGGRREGMIEAAAKSAARSVGSNLGRAILRGTLGGIFGGSSRRR